jgi:hypothetical protein
MPEPALISYELIPNYLGGPTSNNFVFPHEKISVTALAGFKLVSFPPLTNKKMLDNQVYYLISANKPNTELQNKILQGLVLPLLTILRCFLKSSLRGSLPDGASITYEGHYLPLNVLNIWMALAAVH